MANYILKRLALMIPTLFGILLVTFLIVQFTPGGPIERIIAKVQGTDQAGDRIGGGGRDFAGGGAGFIDQSADFKYRGAQGLDPEFIAQLEKQFGFDRPLYERFGLMIWNYAIFDFGKSYFRDQTVSSLILEKMPVSLSLGLWITLVSYLISVPLGIAKAVRDGSRFDVWSSSLIVIGYAIPSFLFGVLLIVVFAGGSFLSIFPLRGLTSDNFSTLPWYGKIGDYVWHMVLPLSALAVGSFATMTVLTKNWFLDEIKKQYVITARAKGVSERGILYGHVFRNAMILVIAGFPGAFLTAFFSGSLLIETIFSLDGLGYLGYKSILDRDYPVVFGTLYIFSLLSLLIALLNDVIYTLIDPRIDFETREV